MICRVMRPFCGALHRLSHGRKERQATFFLSEEAKIAIRGWRAMLCLVHLDEQRFTRSLDSFRDEVPSYVIEFDASLTGAGIIWFNKAGNGTEVCMGASAVDLSGLGFGGDSSYQNTSEYIGAILGIIRLVKMDIRSVDIELRGDSIAMSQNGEVSGRSSDQRVYGFYYALCGFQSGCQVCNTHNGERQFGVRSVISLRGFGPIGGKCCIRMWLWRGPSHWTCRRSCGCRRTSWR